MSQKGRGTVGNGTSERGWCMHGDVLQQQHEAQKGTRQEKQPWDELKGYPGKLEANGAPR